MSRRRTRRNEEQRNRVLGALIKLLALGGALALIVYYAYEVGYRVAQGEVATLKQQAIQAEDAQRKAQQDTEGERAALNEARREAEEFKGLYEQVKPTEATRELSTLLRAKLAEGMDPKRLAFLLKAAQNPHDCQAVPAKRFLVRTPRYKGPPTNTSVRLDDVLSLSADGIGANSGHEQWFDPEAQLKVHVEPAGSKATELAGKLPLEDMVVVRNTEFHFTISASSNRGFVEVTTEKCELR